MLSVKEQTYSTKRSELIVTAPAKRSYDRILKDSRPTRARSDEARLSIRPVNSEAELNEVYRITHDAYLERNYIERQPGGRLIHYPALENIPETTVLIALLEGRILGTVSVTLDGPRGFHVDHDFKADCDAVRTERRRVCACWRIATRRTQRGERQVVMALIGSVVSWAFETTKCETMLCSFNPRHERIYGRLLNMRTIARCEGSGGLDNAPAVLMRCDVETVPARWLKEIRAVVQAG